VRGARSGHSAPGGLPIGEMETRPRHAGRLSEVASPQNCRSRPPNPADNPVRDRCLIRHLPEVRRVFQNSRWRVKRTFATTGRRRISHREWPAADRCRLRGAFARVFADTYRLRNPRRSFPRSTAWVFFCHLPPATCHLPPATCHRPRARPPPATCVPATRASAQVRRRRQGSAPCAGGCARRTRVHRGPTITLGPVGAVRGRSAARCRVRLTTPPARHAALTAPASRATLRDRHRGGAKDWPGARAPR
jgi:hypothetical protein